MSIEKSVLSYYDDDSCNLTAQLTFDGEPVNVSGETITFEVRKSSDDSLVETLTGITDTNGECSVVYDSKGTGELYIQASSRRIVSEIYEIQDIYWFNDCTSNSIENYFNVPSNVSSSSIYGFSSDGWKYGNISSYSRIPMNLTLPSTPYQFDFDLIEVNGISPNLSFLQNDGIYIERKGTTGNISISGTDTGFSFDTGHTYSIKVYSDKLEVYKDNTLVGSKNQSISQSYLELATGTNRYCRLKNMKIRTL